MGKGAGSSGRQGKRRAETAGNDGEREKHLRGPKSGAGGGWGNAKEDMAGGGRDRGKGSDAAALPENDTGSSRANVVVKQEYDDDTGGSGGAMQVDDTGSSSHTFVKVKVEEEDPGSSSEVVGTMAEVDTGSSNKLDIEEEENGDISKVAGEGQGEAGRVEGEDGADQRMAVAQRSTPSRAATPRTSTQQIPNTGANLGSGPRWILHQDAADKNRKPGEVQGLLKRCEAMLEQADALKAEVAGLHKRCEAMLEQALSGSEHGDVRFVLEDGISPLSGHRAVLSAGSRQFAKMFQNGVGDGRIRVPPGVGVEGCRGLLEWVYLGRAGEECAKADGRELWVLGQMFGVPGLLVWLLEKGITESNFGAPYMFGLVPSGLDRERILAKSLVALEQNGSRSLACAVMQGVGPKAAEALQSSLALMQPGAENGIVDESFLLGLERKAVEALVGHLAKKGVGERLGWRYVRHALHTLCGWMTANVGSKVAFDDGPEVGWFQDVVSGLDLMRMPLKELGELLGGCEYVDRAWASDLVQRKKEEPVDNVYKEKYSVEHRYELEDDFVVSGAVNFAFDGKGGPERRMLEVDGVKRVVMRMAVVDANKEVVMLNMVESGKRFVRFASLRIPTGQKILPGGVAFSSTGELYVSDCASDQVLVFDRQGRYLRRFGEAGDGEGQLKRPCGICFAADGNIVVADSGNHRVQVFGKDGEFVRAFGSKANRNDDLLCPTAVCATPDGSFAVFENETCCVKVYDGKGGFVRTFRPRGRVSPGSHHESCYLAVGGGGEIIICDGERRYVQVYHRDGGLLQVIGPGGDSKVQWRDGPAGVCTDAEGRLYIVDGNSVVVLSGSIHV